MLHHYTMLEQDKWELMLPLLEFAVNSSHQESIKSTLYFGNYGKHFARLMEGVRRCLARVFRRMIPVSTLTNLCKMQKLLTRHTALPERVVWSKAQRHTVQNWWQNMAKQQQCPCLWNWQKNTLSSMARPVWCHSENWLCVRPSGESSLILLTTGSTMSALPCQPAYTRVWQFWRPGSTPSQGDWGSRWVWDLHHPATRTTQKV